MLLGLALGLTSTRLQTRVLEVRSEVAGYLKGNTESSQGRRLDYWKRSLKAISEKPLLGHGVGSWKPQYVRLGGLDALPPSNPHNQYLLWAVEGGLIGMAFMIAILVALYRDAQQMGKTVQRAMLTTLAIVVAMCLFNCPFFGAGMGEFLLLMLGALLALGRETSTEACPAQAPQIRCA
jgi:O-antigen ligase